jgi:hypothetical protein
VADDDSLPWSAKCINFKTVGGTAAFGVAGAFAGPHADVPAIIGSWSVMVGSLAKDAGMTMSGDDALKLAAGVATGVSLALAGVKFATMAFTWSGIGTVPAVVANCGLNAAVTYLFGRSVAVTFRGSDRYASVETIIRKVLDAVLYSLGMPRPDRI